MYAVVKIGIERKEDALLVPVDALVAERAGAFVFTVMDNKAKKTRVQAGFNDGTNVEIVSGVKPEQPRSEEHTSELQSPYDLVCRLLLEKKKKEYQDIN